MPDFSSPFQDREKFCTLLRSKKKSGKSLRGKFMAGQFSPKYFEKSQNVKRPTRHGFIFWSETPTKIDCLKHYAKRVHS
jgi:hypothetical protein